MNEETGMGQINSDSGARTAYQSSLTLHRNLDFLGRNGGERGCLRDGRAGAAVLDREVEVLSSEAPDFLPLDYSMKEKQVSILFKPLIQKKKKKWVEVFKQVQTSGYKIIKPWGCNV